ncbi:MAG: hypothetical protein ABL949_03445 [Fimbriimonadaceae bacterium]
MRAILVLLLGILGVCLVAFGFLLTVKTTNSRQITTGFGLVTLGVLLAISYVRMSTPSPVEPFSPTNRQIRNERGVMMGAVLMIAAFVGLFIIPVWVSNRVAQGLTQTKSNMRKLVTSLAVYSSEFNEHYPPSDRWLTASKPYGAGEFRCFMSRSPYSYAMNDALSSRNTVELDDPSSTVVLFEMQASVANAHGSFKDLDAHHGGGAQYGMADTRAAFWQPGFDSNMRWNP